MRTRSGTVRASSWTVPVALLVYAGCRWLDGRDGSYGPGLWWNVGHLSFLMTWIAFAVLTVAMALGLGSRRGVYWPIAAAAGGGITAFGWVTVTDVFQGLSELPDPLRTAGPLLFLAGFSVLLGATARRTRRRRWWCFPVFVIAAVVAVAADLALLPVTAMLFIPALAPCRSVEPIAAAEAATAGAGIQRRTRGEE